MCDRVFCDQCFEEIDETVNELIEVTISRMAHNGYDIIEEPTGLVACSIGCRDELLESIYAAQMDAIETGLDYLDYHD